ncbi:hypothetical protein ABFG93_21465 (plasmid) [Pseudalkalibacillus hwajinpoensis]|uniref:hypothetical protein n=1 Tax=Guptibacillus hwajinpoensis TaxID=208199 RepID=UPI00325B398B
MFKKGDKVRYKQIIYRVLWTYDNGYLKITEENGSAQGEVMIISAEDASNLNHE